jgi:hypothetical protein
MKQFNPFVFEKALYDRELDKWRQRHIAVDSKFILVLTFDELLRMLKMPFH